MFRPWIMLAAAAALLAAGCGTAPVSGPNAPAVPATTLRIEGSAERALLLGAADLASRPAVGQSVHFDTGHGPQDHRYTSAALWPLLKEAGLPAGSGMAAPLDGYVLATGADGYRTLFSTGELDPDFGNKQAIVAYAEVGADGVSKPIESPGKGVALRLTAPGDRKGGRYVTQLVRIEIRPSGAPDGAATGGSPSAVEVRGAVDKPLHLDRAALQAMPQLSRTVNGRVYAGPELWALLGRAGLRPVGSAMNADLLSYVVATGSDGYEAVLSAGELDPAFGDKGAIVAITVDGKDLGGNGMARLIVPGDAKMGRSVSRLATLEVMQARAAR